MLLGDLIARLRFADGASDDEWITLLGRISRADDPGRAFLHHVLSRVVPA